MNCLPSVAMKGASLAAQPRAGIEPGVGDAFGPRRGVLYELRLVHGHDAIDEQDIFTPAIDEHFRNGAGTVNRGFRSGDHRRFMYQQTM